MRDFRNATLAVMAMVTLMLFGTAQAQADGMTRLQILAAVNDQVAEIGWRAEDIQITGRMVREQDDERLVVQSFSATLRTEEALYRSGQTIDGFLFVDQALPVGGTTQVTGDAFRFIAPGVEEQEVSLPGLRNQLGAIHPIDRFQRAGVTTVITGSAEADAALAEIDRRRAEAEAAARAEAERLNALYGGEWISLSRCGNIDFEHRFTIEPGPESGRFTGEVSYRPIYPSPPFELGSHTVNARIDTRRDRLVIEPGTWIERPQGNRGVTITLTAEGGEDGAPVELTGESSNMLGIMASGNCTYRLQRPDAWQAEREETLAPVRALIARMQEGVWIDGSQTGPERDGRTDWPVRVRVSTITENYVVATAELQAFHGNSRRVLGIVEYPFAIFLTRGIENAHIDWGSRPRPRGGDMRNLYTRSNFCPALRITLDAETGVVSGSNNDRQGCIDEIRLPLVP